MLYAFRCRYKYISCYNHNSKKQTYEKTGRLKKELECFNIDQIMQEHLVNVKSGILTSFSNTFITLGCEESFYVYHQSQKQ